MVFNNSGFVNTIVRVFYLTIVLVILYLGYIVVEKFRGENQDAKVRSKQEVVISDLTANNDHLKGAIQVQAKAGVITQDIVSEAAQKQQNNRDTKDNNHKKTEQSVTDIRKDFNDKISQSTDPELSVQLIKEKEIAVSRIRVTALWFNYCKNEPKDPECKEITK